MSKTWCEIVTPRWEGAGEGEGTEDGSEGLNDDAEGGPRNRADEEQLPAAAE